MIQVSILRRDLPGNGQRILPQDSTPTVPPTPPSSNPHLTPHPRILGVFLSFSRARQLLSPSLGNCYRTIQPRMQIAALSRVSRMTFDEIRFRGKEKETRIPLPLLSIHLPPPLFLPRIHLLPLLSRLIPSSDDDEKSTPSPLLANLSNVCTLYDAVPRSANPPNF